VSQTGVTGSGTSSAPYVVTTVVDVGGTGLRITQADSYVVGQEQYLTDILVSNSTSAPISATLYRAGDCVLGSSDQGYGYFDASSGGIYCASTANNSPMGRTIGFRPLTLGASFIEATPSTVSSGFSDGSANPYPNRCDCATFEDNAVGLSWPVVVPAGGSASVKVANTFSPATPPPPVLGKAVDVTAVSGRVLVKQVGQTVPHPLRGAEQIRVGSTVDTTNGRVRLTSAANRHGKTQTEDFYQGAFRVTQKRRAALTTLTLTGGHNAACPHAASAGRGPQASAARHHPRRRLWGSGHGRFGTQGSSASATSQGTVWLTEDDCEGTLISVRRGVVLVRDFGLRKTLLVRAPHSYFAARRR
jgi:hypothetical protein